MTACLAVLFTLLRGGYVKEISHGVVARIINFVKAAEPTLADIQYGLIVLCQILYMKKRSFAIPKEMIFLQLSIDDIIPYVCSDALPNLQLNALMLINALTKYSKEDKRREIIKELNKTQNRDFIYNGLIKGKKVAPDIAHQLYVYQTCMLNIYSELLRDTVNVDETREFLPYPLMTTRKSRNSDDYTEENASTVSCSSVYSNDRSSFGSILNDNFGAYSSDDQRTEDSTTSSTCRFTYQALRYYKKKYPKKFYNSQSKENGLGQGIILTADKVLGVIIKILDIGHEPNKTSEFFHPLLFNTSLRAPFIYELFSRAMAKVSKTREEMKAYTSRDYEKIFIVLEKGIRLTLEKKPTTYEELKIYLSSVTYKIVSEQWEKEKSLEWKNLLEHHPSVLDMRMKMKEEMENLIYKQRIGVVQRGGIFPKIPEKKNKNKSFFLRLSENRKTLYWGEWNEFQKEQHLTKSFAVSDIKYVIIGKACPHFKDNSVKDYERVFSITFSDDIEIINCVAKSKDMCNIWIDALYLLMGVKKRSEKYAKDLKMLTDMQCTMNLLELQEVPIPFEAPAVPPPPGSLPF
ncbi:engulfment and cell motility protein 2-like isoform X2 [Agrilus planipennis]|nr:engulfment and cell motility protein 2-like isoform X2 [Agrilus planipennis]